MDALAWTKLEERPAYSGFIQVRVDTYRTATGVVSEWDVLEQPDTVCLIAFTESGSALAFEQFRVGPARPLLEMPGGLIDPGEDPVAAGLRELREETGFAAAAHWYAGGEWAAASSTRRKHALIASGCAPMGDPLWDQHESGVIREVPPGELLPWLLSGDLNDAGLGVRALLGFARANDLPDEMLGLRDTVRDLLLAR